ncbi:MAG: protein phosphatase [Synechococcaceae cyanobacterium]
MPDAPPPPDLSLQATLFDFAIAELVRQHRDSFAPLWTVESWAKLLIWLALNCGCGADPASLERFAASLGGPLTVRMRRAFFQRDLEDLNLRLLADPAEAEALALPLDPAAGAPALETVVEAVRRVGLAERRVAAEGWRVHEGLIALPWGADPAAAAG